MDVAIFRRRAAVTDAIRRHLTRHGYLEVETPRLTPTPIPESHIELFRTTLKRGGGSPEELFLLPSPEYWLKQLVAAGSGNIFEIARAFRNMEERGPVHEPEFSMLEYYTVNADASDSIGVTEELLRSIAADMPRELIDADVHLALRQSDPYPVISVTEAFSRFADIELEARLSREEMAREVRERGMGVGDEESWEDLFQRLFLSFVEPALPTSRPLFLVDYPSAVPTLAREKEGTPWADRWELYFRGQEVANCYGEEVDPSRIATFMAAEAAKKASGTFNPNSVDPNYLQRPSERLPRCSGVALGIDRLIMVLGGLSSFDGVIYFRISDIVSK